VGERVVLRDGDVTFLKQPGVTAVLNVRDPTGSTNYVEGVDYVLITRGELTQIERVLTSTILLNGMTVLVDYTAAAQGSGTFSTLSEFFQVRLDLWRHLLGLYSRLSVVENYTTDAQFILEDYVATQSGLDVSWHWLRAGAEYETHDSNLIEYYSRGLYQSAFFKPGDGTTLSLDLRERWTEFPSDHRNQVDYSFLTRLSMRLLPRMLVSLQGGVRWQQSAGYDQKQAVARTEFNYMIGKLRLLVGYEFNNDQVQGELRDRHLGYLRVRRSF
jgi:hypothetical protein